MLKKSFRQKETRKPCQKCSVSKGLSSFYANNKWRDELYRDAWCRECVAKFCVDEDTLKEYCMFNKREYSYTLWVQSHEHAMQKLQTNKEFLKITDDKVKDQMIFESAIKVYFQRMGTKAVYKYVNDELNEHEVSVIENKRQEEPTYNDGIELAYSKKTYNKVWCGFYNESEIIYLNNYFDGLSKDHNIDNVSHVDYARKVCKASLAMDKAFSDMLDGKANAEKRFKDMKDVFDSLSQSAKFAQKSRDEEDTSLEYDNLGSIIKDMEYGGYLNKKVEFEKDDIDKIIEDFKWTLMSIGEDVS